MVQKLDPDHLLDRRRLRRKLTFWRVAGLLLFAIVFIGSIAKFTGLGPFPSAYGQHIAEISVEGLILNNPAHMKLLDTLADDKNVLAVIVRIDSPGGTTSGGEALYEALRTLAEKKPTVATIDGFGTSAAYMAAIATDRIFARRSSVVGSIGVIYQSPNFTGLLEKFGIQVEEIKSAALKAAPSPFQPTDPEARRVIQTMIDDNYRWFLEIVMTRRRFDAPTARKIGDGRIYSGDRALSLKLIDELGGRKAAKTWLIAEHGLPEKVNVRPWSTEDFKENTSAPSFAHRFMTFVAGLFNIENEIQSLIDTASQQVKLDGLISVWHGND